MKVLDTEKTCVCTNLFYYIVIYDLHDYIIHTIAILHMLCQLANKNMLQF